MTSGVGCYTSARATGGRVWHADRHAHRLARDARLLGLGEVDEAEALRVLREIAAPTRGGGDAKLRLEARREAGAIRLLASSEPLEADPATWLAISAPRHHGGASSRSRAKTTERALYDEALGAARRSGADEALLFDAAGFLVEGARTNVVVERRDGALLTPPLARGAQAGIARELLLERVAELGEADVARAELAAAREILAINAVRGVRAIVRLDGRPVGEGRAGRWAERLAHAFAEP